MGLRGSTPSGRHCAGRLVADGGDERAARDLVRRIAGAPPCGRSHSAGASRPAPAPAARGWFDRGWRRDGGRDRSRRGSHDWLLRAAHQHHADRPRRQPRQPRATAAARTRPVRLRLCAASRRRGPGTRDPHRRSSGRGRRRRSRCRFAVHSYAYPTDASFFFSSRRASETRHLTVPTGMPSIEPICSYE